MKKGKLLIISAPSGSGKSTIVNWLMKEHPEYTLGAISEACGIKSPATFIRNFKSAYGMTPSEFRNQLEEDSPPPFINI